MVPQNSVSRQQSLVLGVMFRFRYVNVDTNQLHAVFCSSATLDLISSKFVNSVSTKDIYNLF